MGEDGEGGKLSEAEELWLCYTSTQIWVSSSHSEKDSGLNSLQPVLALFKPLWNKGVHYREEGHTSIAPFLSFS